MADFTWRKMRQTEGELTHILLEFAAHRFGSDSVNEAWDEYTFWVDAPMDPESEPELDASFLPWFLYCWTPGGVLGSAQRGEREQPPEEETRRLPGKESDSPPGKKSGHFPEMPVAMSFIEEHPERVEPFQRRFIEEICSQPYSFFMVTGAEAGSHLFLKDLLRQLDICVLERTSSQTLVKGQILYTRVLTMDGVSIMAGCAPVPIPAAFFNDLLDFRESLSEKLAGVDWQKFGLGQEEVDSITRELLSELFLDREPQLREMYFNLRDELFNSSFPQLRNTDGDEMQPVNLHYTLGCSAREAFGALKSLSLGEGDEDLLMDAVFDSRGELEAVRFPWLKKGNRRHETWDNTILGMLDIKGDKLVIEVNSRERAETIKRKITRRLGRRANLTNTVFESLEAMLSEASSLRPEAEQTNEELMAMPEVQEQMREMTERHWATWPDIPVPALEGQTPREAAGTPLGRERLEALLLDFEGKSQGLPPGQIGPDVAALRRELGLGD